MNSRLGEGVANGIGVGSRRFAAGDVDRIAGGAEGRDKFAESGIEVRRHFHQ